MGSTPNPGTWILNVKRKDCSQGYCNFHCPKWCYIIFPPPPPSSFVNNHSTTNFSPLVIAIIGILGSAFLLVSYYAIISKYCKNRRNLAQNMELEGNQDPLNRTLWVVSRNGLDESLIKSIAMFKYKKEDGIVLQGTDCSVCLGDFQEDESLKLLPKCSHAFHETCIDPWLKSHSNCPLCRAKVVADDIEIGIIKQEIVQPTQEGTSNVVHNSETCSVGSDEEHHVRSSLSMDVLSNVSIVKDDDYRIEEGETSKQDCVTTPTPVTISIISPVLSGRFTLSNCGKARNTILPL